MRSSGVKLSPGGCLLVIVTTLPRDASTFSAPHREGFHSPRSFVPRISRGRPLTPLSKTSNSAVESMRRSASAPAFERAAIASTTQLSAHLAYLDSLKDIASQPDLFPATSGYIQTLSQLEDDDGASSDRAPSAEEFLTQLSAELLRASRDAQDSRTLQQTVAASATAAVAVDAAATANAGNPFYNLVEQMVPAVASAIGVGAAAESYNPASYASISDQMLMADGSNHGMDSGYATEYANEGYADYASTTANAVEIANNDGGATESFAAWHTQGGSNSLRDLASTIPMIEPQDVNPAVQETFLGSVDQMNDYSNGGYYLADNVDLVSSFDSSTVANAYASSSSFDIGDTWHSQGGSNALQDLAAAIPTDVEQHDVGFQDNLMGGMDNMMDQIGNAGGYFSTENGGAVASQLSETSEVAQQQAMPVMQDVVQDAAAVGINGVELEPSTAMAAMDTKLIEVAASTANDQAAVASQANNELSNSLASQLSGISYDGLQINGKTASTETLSINVPSLSTEPPSTGLLSDPIKEKLDHLELPQYHIELPHVSNPFTELGPSMQNALSSVKEASGASKEKLDGLFNTMTHSFDGLGDKVADVSHSLEGFSGHMAKVTDAGASSVKAVGSAVQSGASSIGEGMASVKSVGAGLHLPNLNIQAPILPDVKIQVPNLPSPPAMPNVGERMASVKSVGAGLHLPNLNIQTPTLPGVNIQVPNLPPPPAMPNVNLPQPNFPNVGMPQPNFMPELHVVEGTNAAMTRVGEASLIDFGNVVLSAIKFMGGIIIKFIDLILGAVSGTSVASILSNIQTSITSTIDNASHAVVSTITTIGDLSVKEILQHSMAMLIAVSDILLKIMNAVIYIISGKDGANWALEASGSVNGASSQLMAQATSTYNDVTHVSVTELAHSVGDYSQHVGNEFATLMGSLTGVDATALDGIAIPGDTFDSVATAVQTALSL